MDHRKGGLGLANYRQKLLVELQRAKFLDCLGHLPRSRLPSFLVDGVTSYSLSAKTPAASEELPLKTRGYIHMCMFDP